MDHVCDGSRVPILNFRINLGRVFTSFLLKKPAPRDGSATFPASSSTVTTSKLLLSSCASFEASDLRRDASRLDCGFLFKDGSKEEEPMRLGESRILVRIFCEMF